MPRSFEVPYRIARQRRTGSCGVQRRGLLAGPVRGLRCRSTLDSLIVDADGTVTVGVTQHLGRQVLPGADRQTRSGRTTNTAHRDLATGR